MIISRMLVPFVSTTIDEPNAPSPVRQIALGVASGLEVGPVRLGEPAVTPESILGWIAWLDLVGINPDQTKSFVVTAGTRHLIVWQSEQRQRPRMWSLYVITVDTDLPPFPGEDQ